MSEGLIFTVCVIGLTLAWLTCIFMSKGKKIAEYFRTNDGKGALKGILVVLAIVATIVLASSAVAEERKGSWLNWADAYFGLDYTKKVSPMCYENSRDRGGNIDDKTTSNLGFRLNVYETASKRGNVNLKYTHHSCAFNRDSMQYDTVFGFEGSWRFWVR